MKTFLNHGVPLSLAVLVILAGCRTISLESSYDIVQGESKQKIAVSRFEPGSAYQCLDQGFLPCRLNAAGVDKAQSELEEETIVLQCARNILPFSEKMDINYIFVEMPLQMIGITWRDAKANLYRCQSLF